MPVFSRAGIAPPGARRRLAVRRREGAGRFHAGADYLGTREFVDRERIGVLGICGSGSFAPSAAQVDTRIKAVATVSMYDIARYYSEGFGGSLTEETARPASTCWPSSGMRSSFTKNLA